MVKIKEDRMQDLKKFGFKRGIPTMYYTKQIDCSETCFVGVDDGRIWFSSDSYTTFSSLDILYELIKNDMVEVMKDE